MYPYTQLVRATDEFGARIGDARTSCLGDYPHVMTVDEGSCERLDLMRFRMLVEHLKGEIANDPLRAQKFDKSSRRFLLLHNEMRDRGGNRRYDGWKRLVDRCVAEKIGNKVELAVMVA
jgi:hypothetical protein